MKSGIFPLARCAGMLADMRWTGVCCFLASLSAFAADLAGLGDDQLIETLRRAPSADVITFMAGSERPIFVVPLLAVVEDAQSPGDVREQALQAVERITHVSFRKLAWNAPTRVHALEQPPPLEADSSDLAAIAARYRAWLGGEGKESKKWLAAAVARAHKLLEGPKLDDVKRGAMFLGFDFGRRDSDAQGTIDRVAEIAMRLRNPSHEEQREWVALVAAYGPQARLASDTLIFFKRKTGYGAAEDFVMLRAVGGRPIMEYLMGELPKMAEQAKNDVAVARGLVQARRAVDRWAGRTFKTDDERFAWWKDNAKKPPRQWLEDNLITLTQQTDGQLPAAVEIAAEVLPDLPAKGRGEFREKWLKENRAKLEYDPVRGIFRLKSE